MKAGQKHAYDFLKLNHMGILSTSTDDCKPWGSAVYFVVDEDFNIFFVTRMKTFKYQNLDKNPYAALTVVDEETQTTVQLMGKISKVPIADYKDIVFTKLVAIRPKGDPNWAPPIEKVHKGDYIALRITPSKLQYANFKLQSKDFDHNYVEKII